MANDLTKAQKCVVLKSGFEIWVDTDKIDVLVRQIENGGALIKWEGNHINISNDNLVGIFEPKYMDERNRRKNGQWQCMIGNRWHDRFEKCECADQKVIDWNKAVAKARAECPDPECSDGYIRTERGVARHTCSSKFFTKDGKADYDYLVSKKKEGDQATESA